MIVPRELEPDNAFHVDPVQFGKMIAQMENLSKTQTVLTASLDALNNKITKLEGNKLFVWGVMIGIALVSGTSGAFLVKTMEHVK